MGQLDNDFIRYIEDQDRPRGVQPCIVEMFLEFWDKANEEDRRTMWETMRRYAEARRWPAK